MKIKAMDPKQAKKLIDERVHATDPDSQDEAAGNPRPNSSDTANGRESSDLDAHLAANPEAAADLAELGRTRELLASLAGDGPSNQEMEQMWNAILAANAAGAGTILTQSPSTRRAVLQFVAAGVAIAATLVIAFCLGQSEYGLAPLSRARMQAKAVHTEIPKAGPSAGIYNGVTRYGYGVASADETEASRIATVYTSGTGGRHGGAVRLGNEADFLGRRAGAAFRGTEVRSEELKLALGDEDVTQEMVQDKTQEGARLESLGYAGTTRTRITDAAGAESVHRADEAFGVPFTPAAPPETRGLLESDGDGVVEFTLADGAEELRAGYWAYGGNALMATAGDDVLAKGITADREAVEEIDAAKFGDDVSYGLEVSYAWMAPADAKVSRDVPSSPAAPEADEPQERVPVTAAAPTAPVAARQVSQKIIKTGDLAVEVTHYDQAYEQVKAIAEQHGGFIADVNTKEQTGGAMLGTLVIRVPPESFEALFTALKAIGRIESENVKAADVTAQYVDLEARIHSLQITEERLRELLKKKSFMDKISSMLEVERELNRVRSEIEQMQGQLRVMANQVSLSTIRVTLREPARTVPSASLSVEVPALDDARDALGAALESFGGRLLSGKTSKRDDGTLMGDYQLRVSLSSFDALLVAIQGMGRVESRQIKDRQFGDAAAPWADKVNCNVALVLYERSRQLPAGNVTLEVEQLGQALQQLDDVLTKCGGSVTANNTRRRDDGSSVAELSIRVAAGQFADLVEALAPLGRTTGKGVSGEAGQIVGGAANVLCDLKLTLAEPVRQVPSGSLAIEVAKFPSARDALSKIINEKSVQVLTSASDQRTDGTWVGQFRLGIKAADMEPVVTRLASLGRIESRRIIGLGLGDLSQADPKALGVIELALFEKPAVTPPSEQAGGRLRDRLRDGLTGLYASLGLILYGLVMMAPWLVAVLVLAWVITRTLRKRRLAAAVITGPQAEKSPQPEARPKKK